MYDYTLHIKLMEIIPTIPNLKNDFCSRASLLSIFIHVFNFLEISCRSNFGCSKLVDKAISKDLYRFESSVSDIINLFY